MKKLFDWIKKVAMNRIVQIVVVVLVVLYVVFFPHTSTRKVNSDFTGVYTIQKERYFLHNMVEFSVENVCTPGTAVKETVTSYRLSGNIKEVEIVNCDGTYGITKYNSNGTRKSVEVTSFIGATVQIQNIDYNSNGLVTKSVTELNGIVTTVNNKYFNGVDLEEQVTTVVSYGQKTAERVETYDENGDMVSEVINAWNNEGELIGEATETYEDGDIARIDYSDTELGLTAIVSCDSTGCVVTNVTTSDYIVTYNSTTSSYDLLITGETTTRNLPIGNVNEFNYGSIIEDIDEDAKAVIDSLN